MWALSEMLDSAKEAIFIMDWWLTPELYLRRPPAHYPEWRLDLYVEIPLFNDNKKSSLDTRILKRKAEEGVKIYVIVYKEVTQTMSMSSKHTKVECVLKLENLTRLTRRIACIRRSSPQHRLYPPS